MMGPLLAEFRQHDELLSAVSLVKESGHVALDAFTPTPVEGLGEALGDQPTRLRYAMFAGGSLAAAFAYGLQWYSAAVDYPLNLGGRPLHSWQVFWLVPFEVGIFAAALSGVVAFLWSCGLPKPHHALFGVPGFERATQDRYFLLAEPKTSVGNDLRHILEHAGAVVVTEVRTP